MSPASAKKASPRAGFKHLTLHRDLLDDIVCACDEMTGLPPDAQFEIRILSLTRCELDPGPRIVANPPIALEVGQAHSHLRAPF